MVYMMMMMRMMTTGQLQMKPFKKLSIQRGLSDDDHLKIFTFKSQLNFDAQICKEKISNLESSIFFKNKLPLLLKTFVSSRTNFNKNAEEVSRKSMIFGTRPRLASEEKFQKKKHRSQSVEFVLLRKIQTQAFVCCEQKKRRRRGSSAIMRRHCTSTIETICSAHSSPSSVLSSSLSLLLFSKCQNICAPFHHEEHSLDDEQPPIRVSGGGGQHRLRRSPQFHTSWVFVLIVAALSSSCCCCFATAALTDSSSSSPWSWSDSLPESSSFSPVETITTTHFQHPKSHHDLRRSPNITDLIVQVGQNVLLDCGADIMVEFVEARRREQQKFNRDSDEDPNFGLRYSWCRHEDDWLRAYGFSRRAVIELSDDLDPTMKVHSTRRRPCFEGGRHFIASENHVATLLYRCTVEDPNGQIVAIHYWKLYVDDFVNVAVKRDATTTPKTPPSSTSSSSLPVSFSTSTSPTTVTVPTVPIVKRMGVTWQPTVLTTYAPRCEVPRCKAYASVVSAECTTIQLRIRYPETQYGFNRTTAEWTTIRCDGIDTQGYQIWIIGQGVVKKFSRNDGPNITITGLHPGRRYCFNGWAYNACGAGPVFTLEGVCVRNSPHCRRGSTRTRAQRRRDKPIQDDGTTTEQEVGVNRFREDATSKQEEQSSQPSAPIDEIGGGVVYQSTSNTVTSDEHCELDFDYGLN